MIILSLSSYCILFRPYIWLMIIIFSPSHFLVPPLYLYHFSSYPQHPSSIHYFLFLPNVFLAFQSLLLALFTSSSNFSSPSSSRHPQHPLSRPSLVSSLSPSLPPPRFFRSLPPSSCPMAEEVVCIKFIFPCKF